MKNKIIISSLLLFFSSLIIAQNPNLILTFTAENNGTYVQLDSIRIMNRTKDCDTVLYWPDTVLVLGTQVNTPELPQQYSEFKVFQNFPNPFNQNTIIKLYIPKRDIITLIVTDITGRVLYNDSQELGDGFHQFNYSSGGSAITFLNIIWRGETRSIRLISTSGDQNLQASLKYIGTADGKLKATTKSFSQNFLFSFGDTLLNIGYAGTLESGILYRPYFNKSFTFQFAYNIPCPGTPSVSYEGQVYNTVQIFSQCWLKENLNVGTLIPGYEPMTDNGVIEKYCYNNNPDSCDKYGGLYQWDEMMQYTHNQGPQGICPPGWHVSTDDEWKVLEGAADSFFGIGHHAWDNSNWRGNDAGKNLKTKFGWSVGGGNDPFGFSALPGGYHVSSGSFGDIGEYGGWYMSTESSIQSGWYHGLDDTNFAYRYGGMFAYKEDGCSVRCIKNE